MLIMMPFSAILIVRWIISWWKKRSHRPGVILVLSWMLFIGGSALLYAATPFLEPMTMETYDNYGVYKIERDKFDPEQAEWQYEHYEITMTKDRYLRLYKLQPERRVIDSVKFEFVEYGMNKRVRLLTDSTHHHIIRESPTLFREKYWRFYYVFRSARYGNMFFRKSNRYHPVQ